MLSCLLLCCLLLDPQSVTKLQNNGMYLSQLGYNCAEASLIDGSILVKTKYQLWHFEKDGQLRRRFLQKGSGPGEVESLGAVLWTGEFYWVVDDSALLTNVFDSKGQFISRKPIYFRQLLESDGQVFAIDFSRANQFQQNYPPNLQGLRLSVKNNKALIERTDLLFNKVTKAQQNLVMNFKLVWVVKEGETYMVVNQLEPRIYLFDEDSRRAEAAIPIEDYYENKHIVMPLPLYEKAPDAFTKERSKKALIEWWNGWSRINYFGKLGDYYLVGYDSPVESLEETKQVMVLVNREGRAVTKAQVVEGFIIGIYNGETLVFRSDDSDDTFDYYVDSYDMLAKLKENRVR